MFLMESHAILLNIIFYQNHVEQLEAMCSEKFTEVVVLDDRITILENLKKKFEIEPEYYIDCENYYTIEEEISKIEKQRAEIYKNFRNLQSKVIFYKKLLDELKELNNKPFKNKNSK